MRPIAKLRPHLHRCVWVTLGQLAELTGMSLCTVGVAIRRMPCVERRRVPNTFERRADISEFRLAVNADGVTPERPGV